MLIALSRHVKLRSPSLRRTFAFSSRKLNEYQYFRGKRQQSAFNWSDKRLLYVAGGSTALLGSYYFSHLEKVSATGRTRFMNITQKEEEYMSKQAYTSVVNEFQGRFLPGNHPLSIQVRQVSSKLLKVAGMDGLNWEVHVVASDDANAFVLPGGKIFVFTGIFKAAQDDDMLAAVLGHEIAHQLARHSAEKMSLFKLAMWARFVLSMFMDTSFIFHPVIFNVLISLPFSRKCETEADFIGLMLMAQACYDPAKAITFWRRMKQLEQSSPVQLLSTHPNSETRVQKIEQWMPEARNKFHDSDCEQYSDFAHFFADKFARW